MKVQADAKSGIHPLDCTYSKDDRICTDITLCSENTCIVILLSRHLIKSTCKFSNYYQEFYFIALRLKAMAKCA
jgi:hypothetical protein